MSELLIDEPRSGVRRLTLNRPDRLNAMTEGLLRELHNALDDIDQSCRVVVLTGAGRGFCAGLDLDGFASDGNPTDVIEGMRVQRWIASAMQKIRRLDQPVVAAVNGAAAGGGFALVCTSDVRIASSEAVFATSFIRVGYSGCDMGVSWMLPRLVGAGRAHELMLTGRRFDAAEAQRIGLLADVVEPADFDARIEAAVDALLHAAPLSLSLTKQGMWLGLEVSSFDQAVELENRQQVITIMSGDQTEAMQAFRERRPPSYL